MIDRRLLSITELLIGPAFGAQSMFYFKPPTARGQAMHQDNYFLRAHPETCLAAWIAIDDCDAANGALSVVPGSHTMEVVCPEEADADESFTTGLVWPPDGMEPPRRPCGPVTCCSSTAAWCMARCRTRAPTGSAAR